MAEPEIAVQTQAAPEPTDAQVASDLNLREPETTAAPAPVTAQTATASPQAAPNQDELVKALLAQLTPEFDKRLTPISRELGQFRKLQSELAKKPQQEYKPPTVWNELDPAQQQAYEALVDHIFQQKYGKQFTQMSEAMQGYQSQQLYSQREQIAKSYAGNDWQKLDKFAGDIYREAVDAEKNGDENARVFLDEFDTTQSGVMRLVDLARQRAGKEVENQNKEAEAAKLKAAQSAATSVSSARTETQASVQLPVGNDPKTRGERLKLMEKELGLERR